MGRLEAMESTTSKRRNCVSCGRSISWDANVCPYCGHDFRVSMMMQPAKKESSMPTIGGVLILLAGLIEIGAGAVVGLVGAGGSFGFPTDATGFLAVCGGVLIVLGLISIMGAIFAMERKHFGLAVLGGILSLPGFFILGLIGLILIAVSKDEFES